VTGSTTLTVTAPVPTDTVAFNTQGGRRRGLAERPGWHQPSPCPAATVAGRLQLRRLVRRRLRWQRPHLRPYTLARVDHPSTPSGRPTPPTTVAFNSQGRAAAVASLSGPGWHPPSTLPAATVAGPATASPAGSPPASGGSALTSPYTLAGVDHPLYAQWTANPTDTVAFNTQGGSAVASLSGLDGTTVTPARGTVRWPATASPAGSPPPPVAAPLTSPYTLAGSTTLYAQWTANPTDTVAFNTQGGQRRGPR